MRAATVRITPILKLIRISIHAAHEGCDAFLLYIQHTCHKISIHAAHEGCDARYAALGK